MGYWERETDLDAGATRGGWVWRTLRLPRISDELLECSIYLYPDEASADAGAGEGGSGFLLGVTYGSPEPLKPQPALTLNLGPIETMNSPYKWGGTAHVYAVTNRHVVVDRACRTLRFNTKAGGTKIFDASNKDWLVDSLSDLAVLPLDHRDIYQFRFVTHEMILTEDDIQSLDVGIGDDAFAIGRLMNHDGLRTNNPIARFGNIAAMPREPIFTDVADLPPQMSILAEIRTLPGSSGSPVFLRIPAWEMERSDRPLRRRIARDSSFLLRLLGVTSGYLHGPEVPLKSDGVELEDYGIDSNSGLMVIIPAWKLLEVLNNPRLVKLREQDRENGHPSVSA